MLERIEFGQLQRSRHQNIQLSQYSCQFCNKVFFLSFFFIFVCVLMDFAVLFWSSSWVIYFIYSQIILSLIYVALHFDGKVPHFGLSYTYLEDFVECTANVEVLHVAPTVDLNGLHLN
jgi:hypothetical protein